MSNSALLPSTTHPSIVTWNVPGVPGDIDFDVPDLNVPDVIDVPHVDVPNINLPNINPGHVGRPGRGR